MSAGPAAARGVGPARAGMPLPGMLEHVRQVLQPVPRDGSAVVAVSGGPDSAALAWLVQRARPDLALRAVHVRHGLRDDRADVAAAGALADRLGLPLEVLPVRVTPREGLEADARTARYAALAAAAGPGGWALVGHTADDQAETVLLNLARGTGLAGLGGMAAVRDLAEAHLARPLLRLRRSDVRALTRAQDLPAVEDPMNSDLTRRRNRARHDVLPALARLSGGTGDPVGALGRLADLARGDAALLDELAAVEVARLVRGWGPVRLLPTDALAALPPALASRVVRTVIRQVRGSLRGVDAACVHRITALAPGGLAPLPGGGIASVGGGWLALAPAVPAPLPGRALRGGRAALAEIGAVVRVARRDGGAPATAEMVPPGGRADAVTAVRPGVVRAVRGPRPGDHVPGPTGPRRIARLLLAAGIPRLVRPLVPVAVDAQDRPVWVAGIALHADADGDAHVRLEPCVATGGAPPGRPAR